MELNVDLHAHSGYAGGTLSLDKSPKNTEKNALAVKKRFEKAEELMKLKGVQLFGTGDCQFLEWQNFLKKELTESEEGIYYYKNNEIQYLLQTELIFTAKKGKRSKQVHTVFLLPNHTISSEMRDLFDKWKVNHQKMARPFLVCETVDTVSERVNAILDLDPYVEAIPAHVMTPQGVFGSSVRMNSLKDFYGESAERIHAVETGLSADPYILGLIPELDEKTLLSNSDAHSPALNRMAREFTTLKINKINYKEIIKAIRSNKVVQTFEFPPQEGRYFLTGHRPGRKKPGLHEDDEYCMFSPKYLPKDDICPICHKELTIGVLQRVYEISRAQGSERELGDFVSSTPFVQMVPLIEVILSGLNISTVSSKRANKIYREVVTIFGSEVNLWKTPVQKAEEQLGEVKPEIKEAIVEIIKGNFTFKPLGYDGTYGALTIGETSDFLDVNIINHTSNVKKGAIDQFLSDA
ncbi:MAG: endonuclease Q family protein [Candidatus Kariarchaeaceae archaeon]